MSKLTEEQILEVRSEMVPADQTVPCRFLLDGQALNVESGNTQPRGINVIHQLHYWNFKKETAKKIAGWLGCRVEFSQ